ncbi:pyocin knob domain-containing protein [Lactobacillus equicursoris]|uniref:pyocin knob domain-containing protein n=1 Tax=Lactobacillus equicursoris TaxID=420645 RepID=UPI0024325B65|nr:pyocin knob domain-containing protein [Lactobacillus equicursoris]MDD6386582.1 pyocin knob domain-containing protein [Lactobacillus equicursoris]
MASYGNTVLTSAGIDLVKRVIAKTATFEITRVATSSDSRLTNATISAIEAMTALSSVNQTGTVTAFDTSNDKRVGLKCEFTNQGLTNPYNICGVGIYAKEAGKSEILFAVAPAKEPETMPAKPNDQSALFSFSLNMYVVVGQASAMSITATTEGVVKSINGTIKPDANGNVILPFQSQAEANQLRTDLTNNINNTAATLTATITKNKADADSKLEAEANTRAQNDNAFNNRLNALSDALTSETANRKNNIDSLNSTLSNGGVNLLSGTKDFSWLTTWWAISGTKNQSNTYNDSERVTEHKCVMSPNGIQGFFWGGNNTVGQTYTLSFDARCDNGKAKIYQMGLEGNFLVDAALTTDWTRYHVSGKVTENHQNWITYFSTTEADNVYTRKYQIEYGETATPWKPSNGDIASLQQAVQGLTADMKDAKAKAEANANSIQALSANLNASGYTATTRTNGVDLNGFTELGSYYFPSSANCTNCPINPQSQFGDMCVENRKVGATIVQKCYSVKTYGTVYIRTTSTNGSSWDLWAQINGLYIADF